MHASQELFLSIQERPVEGQSTAQAQKRWDDAKMKARSIIVQTPGTEPIIDVSGLI